MSLVIGLGAGGHAKVLMEILLSEASCTLVGLLDPRPEMRGQDVLGVPVLGGDDLLPELAHSQADHFFVGLGGVGDNRPRQRLFDLAISLGLQPLQIIHRQAIISPSANLANGVMILAGAVVNADAIIGANTIINTHAVVEHDCVIGAHVHIAIGAQLAGGVCIDNLAHIGIGATILQGVHIGASAVVGAGAVVLNDVAPAQTVVGVPARVKN